MLIDMQAIYHPTCHRCGGWRDKSCGGSCGMATCQQGMRACRCGGFFQSGDGVVNRRGTISTPVPTAAIDTTVPGTMPVPRKFSLFKLGASGVGYYGAPQLASGYKLINPRVVSNAAQPYVPSCPPGYRFDWKSGYCIVPQNPNNPYAPPQKPVAWSYQRAVAGVGYYGAPRYKLINPLVLNNTAKLSAESTMKPGTVPVPRNVAVAPRLPTGGYGPGLPTGGYGPGMPTAYTPPITSRPGTVPVPANCSPGYIKMGSQCVRADVVFYNTAKLSAEATFGRR